MKQLSIKITRLPPPSPTPPLHILHRLQWRNTTAYAAMGSYSYFNVSGPYKSDPYAAQPLAAFIRRNLLPIIGMVICTGAIVFLMIVLIFLILPPLPRFRLDTFTLSDFNVTSTSLVSGNWEARFSVRNPSSMNGLQCDHIQAAVFYKGEAISDTSVAPFDQSKKTATTVTATFATLSAYVDNGNGIRSDRGRGTVEFTLKMVARVQFVGGISWVCWAIERILLITCRNLSVGVPGNHTVGSLVGGSKRCKVGGLWSGSNELEKKRL